MTLDDFKQSAAGKRLASLLTDGPTIARMEEVTRAGKPAVKAIDEEVAARVGRLSRVERQHVGRWVRDVLGDRGWRPIRQVEWRGGKAFTSGAVYAPAVAAPYHADASPTNSPADRLTEAQRILAASRYPDAPVDSVAAFLADRRRMWGTT